MNDMQYYGKRKADKQKYEELIERSPFFSLVKEENPYTYKSERLKLIEYLYSYLMACKAREYEPYSVEITEVATRCINNYDRSKGIFLHYFNAAWKTEFMRITRNNIFDKQFRGIKITEQAKRAITRFIECSRKMNSNLSSEELYRDIAEKVDIPIEEVRKIVAMHETCVCGTENTEIRERCRDEKSFEQDLEIAEGIKEMFDKIESLYESLQERQKAIVADAITARILSGYAIEPSAVYRFVSRDICDEYKRTGRVPTQRAIAAKYNRNEASLSRTINEFVAKLEKRFCKENESVNKII